jgi:hypothetical protein
MFENLTKENFFNDIYEKYPSEVQQFCKWVDQYKKKNNWVGLFGTDEVKFHHLPLAMQIGIFIQFCAESGNRYGFEIFVEDAMDFEEIKDEIAEYFAVHNMDSSNEKTRDKYS